VSLTADLLQEFERDIEALTLIPSDGGRFEVTLDGDLVYSKLATGRHTTTAEIAALVRRKLGRP